MANSTQMAQAISATFGVELVKAEVISRTLMENGLRAQGGRGRGATTMLGRDIFNVAIVLAGGVGMREAPEYVKSIIEMPLDGGYLMQNDRLLWDAPTLTNGKFNWLHKAMPVHPLPDMEVLETFGPFVSAWIDGLFDTAFTWKTRGSLQLEISNVGPRASFSFKDDGKELLLMYATPGFGFTNHPAWERRTVLRGELFRKFVDILTDDKH